MKVRNSFKGWIWRNGERFECLGEQVWDHLAHMTEPKQNVDIQETQKGGLCKQSAFILLTLGLNLGKFYANSTKMLRVLFLAFYPKDIFPSLSCWLGILKRSRDSSETENLSVLVPSGPEVSKALHVTITGSRHRWELTPCTYWPSVTSFWINSQSPRLPATESHYTWKSNIICKVHTNDL